MAKELTVEQQAVMAALRAADGGDADTTGVPMPMRALVFFKRNHQNTPVKVCAALIGKSHSRVTEIAGGRDYKRYDDKMRAEFVELIQAEYASVGLVYTGDYCGNNSSKKLPKPKA